MNKIIFFCFLILGFASCKQDSIVESTGRIRLVNASYNTGDINLMVEYGKVYATNVQYLNYSLFRDFIAGKRKVQITNASGNVIVDTAITIEENKTYSLFLYDSANNLKYKQITEQFITPTGSSCKVRFMHLSNNAPSVNAIQQFDTTIRFNGYQNGQYSEYTPMPSGVHTFHVKDALQDTLIYSNLNSYSPGFFYTVYLKGNTGSNWNDSIGFFIIKDNGNY